MARTERRELQGILLTAASILLVLCLSGYGRGLQTLLGRASDQMPSSIFESAFYGLFLVTAAALAANFAVGLGNGLGVVVLAVGLLLFLVLQARRDRIIEQLFLLVVVVAAVYVVAGRISFSNDAGLYHIPAMDWIAFEPVPLGLANLHSRFGFNSAFLLFEAAFRSEYLLGWHHLYIIEIAVRSIAIGWLVSRLLTEMATNHWNARSMIYAAALVVVLAFLARFSRTSTDTCATLLSICAWVSFSKLVLMRDREVVTGGGAELSLFLLLITLAVTFKVSMLPIAALVPLVLVLRGWRETLQLLRSQYRIVLVLAAYCILWLTRNFMLSGCLVYPAPVTCASVPWGVGPENAQNEQSIIRAWARRPGQGFRAFAPLGNLDWLPEWLARLRASFELHVAAFSGLFFLASILLSRRHSLYPREHAVRQVIWASVGLAVLGLTFWFLSAPAPRFAAAFFAILSAALIFAGLVRIGDRMPRLKARTVAMACLFLGVAAAALLPWTRTIPLVPPTPPSKTVSISDWRFHKPISEQKCWTLFPCTPQKVEIERVEIRNGRTVFVRKEERPSR